MKGSVRDNHALLDVIFIWPDGSGVPVEMVVDTGYVGTLTLPSSVIQRLGLPFLRNMTAKLADGSSIDVDIHTSTILWHGSEIKAEVIALEDRPLLGMMFLDGCRMNVDFVNGGLMELSEVN